MNNDIINEEARTIESLSITKWMGITDIMKITNVGYYRTLSILDELIKQKAVMRASKGEYFKYRKINDVLVSDTPQNPTNPTREPICTKGGE